jgi:hypothetical protein
MPRSAIQGHVDEFDERNNLLYFVLGMISLSYSVLGSMGLPIENLARPTSEPAPRPEPEAPAPELPTLSLLR